MSRKVIAVFVIAAFAVFTVFAFSPDRHREGPVVLAAASLQESLVEAADAWTGQGNPRPVLSFAGTPALARQVIAGSPADLFISADEKWMDELASRALIRAESRAAFLTNQLVIIAPADSPFRFDPGPGVTLDRQLGSGRLAMADPDSVPAGRYGKQALTRLGVWQSVSGRVTASDSVRQALALVARGEAPLGIVYATDAKSEPRVRVVATLPQDSHDPIIYPIAILTRSGNDEAQSFRQFLLSPAAMAIFRRHGFDGP